MWCTVASATRALLPSEKAGPTTILNRSCYSEFLLVAGIVGVAGAERDIGIKGEDGGGVS